MQLEFWGVKPVWLNLSGIEKGHYDKEGDRNFKVKLTHEEAADLEKQNILVSWERNPEPGTDPSGIVKIHASYKYRTPTVWLITNKADGTKKKKPLTIKNIGEIDSSTVLKMDVKARTGRIDKGPYQGSFSLYLDTLFVEIQEDRMHAKYDDIPEDDGTDEDYMPFD